MSDTTTPMIFEGSGFNNGVEAGRARTNERSRLQRRLALAERQLVDMRVYMKESVETDEAILIYDGSSYVVSSPIQNADGSYDPIEQANSFWLPKSQVEYEIAGPKIPAGENVFLTPIDLTIPVWLCEKKGLDYSGG